MSYKIDTVCGTCNTRILVWKAMPSITLIAMAEADIAN